MMQPNAPARSEAGFTLLEVLIAFTVLTLTLTAVLQLFSGGLRSSAAADDMRAALTHAQNELARLGSDTPLVEGEMQGTFDDAYRWTRTLTPVSAGGGMTLFDVEVRVETPDGTRAVTLQSQKIGVSS